MAHWKDADTRQGRVASLDRFDRVIWIVPAMVKLRDFKTSGAKIIHPAVGTSMLKEKAKDRPKLGDSMLRWLTLWRVAIQQNCEGLAPSVLL